ncbi:hypothetical protein LZC95_07860 [Pendulispora brunnea]|uniref:Stc1 domain-containing protein n=1 Tax=Pendulispora brunnea TaxID=2905690 RepID=A0ABZ2KDJ5_9BACT
MNKANRGRCAECDAPLNDTMKERCTVCAGRAQARRHGHLAMRQGHRYECCVCDASGIIESGAPLGSVFSAGCPNRPPATP